jgi:hypothetical protein
MGEYLWCANIGLPSKRLPGNFLQVHERKGKPRRRRLFGSWPRKPVSGPLLLPLGTYRTDVGRIDNVQYGFYASGLIPLQDHVPEQGIELRLVTRLELEEMIETGVFDFALHLAVWERFIRKFPKSARP